MTFELRNDDDELKSKSHRRRITNEINDAIDSKFDENENENEKFAKTFENSLIQSYIDSNSFDLNDSIFDAKIERS